MRPSPRILLAVASLVAAPAAIASTASAEPTAHASGGDAPPVIPATVRTHIRRGENELDRLGDNVDDDDAAAATRTGALIRQQLVAAWRGAEYIIKNAPPPVGDDARVRPAHAHASGDGPAAPVIADPPTVALAVFQFQDDLVSGVVALFDGADAGLLTALSPTLDSALDHRDAAVADVHKLAPPTADDSRATAQAHAAGGEVVNTFDTVMPQVPEMLDDELQQIDALKTGADDLLPAGTRILKAAESQILLTEHHIDAYWPPVSDDD